MIFLFFCNSKFKLILTEMAEGCKLYWSKSFVLSLLIVLRFLKILPDRNIFYHFRISDRHLSLRHFLHLYRYFNV